MTTKLLTDTDEYKQVCETKTIGSRSVTCYAGGSIVDLGTVTKDEAANLAIDGEIWMNPAVHFVLYKTSNGISGCIINSYDTTQKKCTQVRLHGQTQQTRSVMSGNVAAFETTGADYIQTTYDAATRKLATVLHNYHGELIATPVANSVVLPLATTAAAGLMPAADKANLTGVKCMGWYTSLSEAYNAAATIDFAAPKNLYTSLAFFVNSAGDEELPTSPSASSLYGSGFIYQHFYKDNTTEGWKVWQYMPCDGTSGNRYKRLVTVNDAQTEVLSVAAWETC